MTRLSFLLACAACGGGGSPSPGELSVRWSGADGGDFLAPAAARWCVRDTLLEVFASRNDTAFGIALLPRDTVAPGAFSVFSTDIFIPIRPQASLALRYLDPGELRGFGGASGSVQVTDTAGGTVTGTFDGVLRREGTPDTVRVSGRFSRVAIEPAIEMCGRANRPGGG
jgi:hypothetical protein